jgi:hypothetical protein
VKGYARAVLVGLLLGAIVWAVLTFLARAKEGADLDYAAQASLVHRLLADRWKEAKVHRLDPGKEDQAPTIVVVTGRGDARRPAPPAVVPPVVLPDGPATGGISGVGWFAPEGWPSPDDLSVACRAELKTAAGRVFGKVTGDACVNLPGGGQTCRGAEDLEDVSLEVAPVIGKVAAPTPWALDFRAMATGPDPGFLLGVSGFKRSRWGWAMDAGVQNVDGITTPVVAFGVAVRFGRGATSRP